MKNFLPPLLLFYIFTLRQTGDACRVGSEPLKNHVQQIIENLMDASFLETIYWPDEPLDSDLIARATGLNITNAETKFQLPDNNANDIADGNDRFIRDIFVTCSVDRDRSYALAINLELDNPFKNIDASYEIPLAAIKRENNNSIVINNQVKGSNNQKRFGRFHIRLPQSTFLVQLNQRIRYDECIVVNYVQLAPNVNYDIECASCDAVEQKYLDKVFSKRMTQLDAELDAMLSGKFLLGLQLLLNQQRLDLELLMD